MREVEDILQMLPTLLPGTENFHGVIGLGSLRFIVNKIFHEKTLVSKVANRGVIPEC
jgi:hypothetical protein